jgi:xylulokinase
LGATILGAVGCGQFASIDEAVEHMVTITGELEPDTKRHEMYSDLYGVFRDTLFTLRDSGIYERLSGIQAKYWGGDD